MSLARGDNLYLKEYINQQTDNSVLAHLFILIIVVFSDNMLLA